MQGSSLGAKGGVGGWHPFFSLIIYNPCTMKNLLYNLNSVESSYGEVTLTNVIQIFERVDNIAESATAQLTGFTDFDKEELTGRLDKLIALNLKVRSELRKQEMLLLAVKMGLHPEEVLS